MPSSSLTPLSLSSVGPSPSSVPLQPRPYLPLRSLSVALLNAVEASSSPPSSPPSPSAVILSLRVVVLSLGLPSLSLYRRRPQHLIILSAILSSIFRPPQRLIRQSYSPPSILLLCDGDFPRPSLEYRSPLFPPPLFATMVSLACLSPLLPTPHRQPPASLPRCQPCFPPLLFS
ncbi:hypothetical protein ACLOJK_016148 [Asimina triloba]